MIKNKEIWLSKELLSWNFSSTGGSITEASEKNRAFDIWSRANLSITNAKNADDLSDGILTLKRSLNQRIKKIEEIYNLANKEKEIEDKPKGYIDLLFHLGIIRPLFIREIFEIRNSIEHDDSKPPTKRRCLELVDIVWYFLKSTDQIIDVEMCEFEVFSNKEKYWYGLTVDWKKSTIDIHGWFPQEYFSNVARDSFVMIKANKIQTAKEFKSKLTEEDSLEYHKDKIDTDLVLDGKLILSEEDGLLFYRNIFK